MMDNQKTTIDFIQEDMAKKLEPKHRSSIDVSDLNAEDQRTTWLKFRWCLPVDKSTKNIVKSQLRSAIEELVIDTLRAHPGIKVSVNDHSGSDCTALSGHVAGKLQAMIKGVESNPTVWHILHTFAVSHKDFEAFKNSGSLKHWSADRYQHIQTLMGISKIENAYVVVYCRNDARMLDEIIDYEEGNWQLSEITARSFIDIDEPPPSSYPGPDYFAIKRFHNEDYQRIYWGDALPKPNCRNCKRVKPRADEGDWLCTYCDEPVPLDVQVDGCPMHLFNTNLVKGKVTKQDDTGVWYRRLDGTQFCNSVDGCADLDAMIFDSDQLYKLSSSKAFVQAGLGIDDEMRALINAFDGTFEKVETSDE